MTEKYIGRIVGTAGDSLLVEFASASAQASKMKRIRMSQTAQRAKCVQPRGKSCLDSWFRRHKRPLGSEMTGKLIWINDSIGEFASLLQAAGVLFGECRLKRLES